MSQFLKLHNKSDTTYRSFRHVPFAVLGLAVLAAYLMYQLVVAFAASPVVGSVEAEAMSRPAGASIVNDPMTSGGKTLKFTQNGTATANFTLSAKATSITVIAGSQQCSGVPVMNVTVDSTKLINNASVTGDVGYLNFNASANLAAGSHRLNIAVSNLGSSRGCSRVLYVDVTNFYGASAPTVSLGAAPTTINAGASSTLTWSSTNATSCTASGAWSGTKATSGTTSVTPSATSTYGLSCTGTGGGASASTTVTVNAPLNQALGFNTLNTAISDDFTGTAGSKPNATKWAAKEFPGTNGSVAYWNGLNNIQLDGTGNLDIFATRADATYWNSGWISGLNSYTGPHYIEARAKVPTGQGVWSAPIWEWDAPYGALGTENDVIEQLGVEPQSYHTTLHSAGTQVSKQNDTAIVLGNDYHTYAAAVYTDHVDYYLDGTKIQTITKAELGVNWGYTSSAMILNINFDLGGWGGTPSPTLPSPSHLLVDYIRAYTP